MRRIIAAMLSLFIVLLAAGCGSGRQDPPKGEPPVSPKNPDPPAAQTTRLTVYFGDWQAQHVIPEERAVPAADGAALANRAVSELLAGPTDPHLHRTIPTEVKLAEPVTLVDGIAYVNLSKDLLNMRGAAGVAMFTTSLTYSLTEITGIQKVQILVEGKKDVMLDEGLILEPMQRQIHPYPVFPDPDRIKYLQERVGKSQETWRLEPEKVLQFEGRMFGFTAEQLKAPTTTIKMVGQSAVADKAVASVTVGKETYQIQLERNSGVKEKERAIWVITGIETVSQ